MFEHLMFARLLSRVHHYHLSIEGDDNAGAGSAAGDPGTGAGTDAGAADAGTAAGAAGLSALGDDTSGDLTAPADWPSDWRERIAGSDEAALRELKRYGGPNGLWTKIVNQNKIISDRAQHRGPPPLPENATEEQVAEYRKALGVPETPDGYGITFDASLKPTDADKETLNGFLSHMHGKNISPAAAKEAFDWYQQNAIQQREAMDAAAQRERARVSTELRKEYGADYKKNLGLADEFLAGHPGLAKLVRPDNPDLELVKDIIKLARDSAPEDVLYSGDGDAGGKSLDEQLDELTQKSIRGKLSATDKAKYDRLTAAAIKRDERKQSRAA